MPSATPARPRVSPWLAAIGSALIVVALAVIVVTGVADPFDVALSDVTRAPAARDVLAPLRQITELGSSWAVAAVAVILLVVGSLVGRPRDAILGALAVATGSGAVEVLKALVARARPEILEPILVETGFSFPSGHAANSMVAFGIAAVVVGRSSLAPAWRRAIQVVLGAVVGLVGISRVWLGVHYPTDVLAGWAIGAVGVLVYVALTRREPPAPGAAGAGADPAGPRSGRPGTG